MKSVLPTSVTLVDHIRAEAGSPEAQFDARVCALFAAYRHILKAGNRTQFNMVDTAIKAHADIKVCKASLGVTTATAPVKRMHAVYLAYGAALAHVGVPPVMKGAAQAEIDACADTLAQEFASIVQVALTPEPKQVKSDADKAAAKQARADKLEIEALAEQQAIDEAVDTRVASIAAASALTMADMVQAVANAIQQGLATPDQLALLDAALDSVAANVTLLPVSNVALEQRSPLLDAVHAGWDVAAAEGRSRSAALAG